MKATLHDGQYTFSIMSRLVLLRTKSISDKSCREFRNRRFKFSICFFENRAISEIMWKNNVKRGRPQITMGRRRIACWITKAADANSEYVIIIVFPQQP